MPSEDPSTTLGCDVPQGTTFLTLYFKTYFNHFTRLGDECQEYVRSTFMEHPSASYFVCPCGMMSDFIFREAWALTQFTQASQWIFALKQAAETLPAPYRLPARSLSVFGFVEAAASFAKDLDAFVDHTTDGKIWCPKIPAAIPYRLSDLGEDILERYGEEPPTRRPHGSWALACSCSTSISLDRELCEALGLLSTDSWQHALRDALRRRGERFRLVSPPKTLWDHVLSDEEL